MTANENNELVLEEELLGLFAAQRPDAKEFEDGVQARIKELEKEGSANGQADAPLFMQKVAALIPMVPIAETLFGKVGGKLVVSKGLPAVIALPAMMILAAIGGFAASTRSIRRTTQGSAPVSASRVGGWSTHTNRGGDQELKRGGNFAVVVQGASLIGMLAALVFGGDVALDVVILALLSSMVALVISMRGLAKLGLLAREEVAMLGTRVLILAFSGCVLQVRMLPVFVDRSSLGAGATAVVLLLGILACLFTGNKRKSIWLAIPTIAFLGVFLNVFGLTNSSPESLAWQLEGCELDTNGISDWEEAGQVFEALRAVNANIPSLAHVAAELETAIEGDPVDNVWAWTAAARMGLIDGPHWARVVEITEAGETLDKLVRGEGRLNPTTYYEYIIPMLLATRELTEDQHKNVVAAVQAAWPDDIDQDPLGNAAMCVHLLDLLGEPELVDERQAEVHQMLEHLWGSPERCSLFAATGGFAAFPRTIGYFSSKDSTWAAIALMARVGVPESIDLRVLRDYLRRESTGLFAVASIDPFQGLHLTSRASLLRLEQEIGLPQRSWLNVLLHERLLIASLLVVLLCLVAIRMTPLAVEEFVDPTDPG